MKFVKVPKQKIETGRAFEMMKNQVDTLTEIVVGQEKALRVLEEEAARMSATLRALEPDVKI